MKQDNFGVYLQADDGQPPVWNEAFDEKLLKHGFIAISDVKFSSSDDLLQYGKTIGSPLTYAFGNVFKIQGSDGEKKTQLSNRAMCIHQDAVLPEEFAEIVMLYCEVAPQTGGESLLCDNRAFLELLRQSDKELYDFFVTKKVGYLNHTPEYYISSVNESDWIIKDSTREHYKTKEIMPYFAFNQFDDAERNFTAKFVGYSLEESDTYMRRLDSIMRDERVMVAHKLSVGDLIIFDNTLVSHGRNGYEKGDKRILNRVQVKMTAARDGQG